MGDQRFNLIDKAIARKHATLRMPFNSKLSNGYYLLIDDWKGPESFFNALIQDHEMDIFDPNFIKQMMVKVDTNYLQKLYNPRFNENMRPKKISLLPSPPQPPSQPLNISLQLNLSLKLRQILKKALVILNCYDKDYDYNNTPVKISKIEAVIKLIEENQFLMSMFTIAGHSQGFINLNRIEKAACIISGKVHTNRPSFLTCNGNCIKLFCRNPNCQTKFGKKYKVIYMI
jgi:hypothetical protein